MHNEKIFTPAWMVNLMLDKVGYKGKNILNKHIIDNSCGDGAFLKEIVRRYCKAYKEYGTTHSNAELIYQLSTYIHGIEIDKELYRQSINNLNNLIHDYGIEENLVWDINCADALIPDNIEQYIGKMDYVVGNPPYCNVHDFGDKYDIIKSFSFAQGGMTDLYLVFFELGINLLNNTGKLIYISASSWTTSLAGKPFRKYLKDNNILSDIVTLGHERVFKNATTFTIITELDKNKLEEDKGNVSLYRYNPETKDIDYIANRPLSVFTVGGCFYFNDDIETINLIKEIEKKEFKKVVIVKNGFATLKDKLFVIDEDIPIHDKKYWLNDLIPVIKASTGEYKWMVFPYDIKNNLKPLKFEELSEHTQEFLNKRIGEFNIKKEGEWWLYGRTQAIKDYGVWNRYSINNLIRNKDDIKIIPLYHFYGVYSGYYITVVDENIKYIDWDKYLITDEFEKYVKALGRYKNGGYYTYTTKELENYLNYKLGKNG